MRLGTILKMWRLVSQKDIRSVAAEIGVGASTLLRVERGITPDGATLIKIMNWMFTTQLMEKAANGAVTDGSGDAGLAGRSEGAERS
jgi:transcriptional regulator with XRE-family HTH domain